MRNRYPVLRGALVIAAAFAFLTPGSSRAQQIARTPRITAKIDNTVRVQIPHSTHPLAQPAFDTGRLEGSAPFKRMILILSGSPQQDHDLVTLVDSQQTKGSPDYHHWLTPDQIGERFGPAPEDLAAVTNWLQQQGFGVDHVARSGKFIQFTGTSAQVEAAFQTQMHRYRVNGEAHIANATNISIPAALAPVVRGIASLNDFFPKAPGIRGPRVRRGTGGKYQVISPDTNLSDGSHGLSPADFAAIYDLNPLYNTLPTALNGSGITIAIVAISDIIPQDVADFRTVFGLPANPPTIIVDGEDPGDVGGADAEATLDTEWSGAIAPGATIDVVISGDSLVTSGIESAAIFIVDQNLAQVMNASFSACEQNIGGAGSFDNVLFETVWQQAAAQGISAFVSTGDTGAAGCDPNQPVPAPGATGGVGVSGIASTPYNTAVGGTMFNETGAGDAVPPNPPTSDVTFWSAVNNAITLESALGYIPEAVWNESCVGCADGEDSLGGTGGGLSTIYAVPSWQTLPITGLTGAGFNSRALPDVSLAAAGHDGYLVCFEASCEPTDDPEFFVAGGTSFSSPSFAGIMAIVDQKMAAIEPTTGGAQGLANYTLYSLATAENFGNCNSNTRVNPATGTACVFNDITVGNNGVPGNDITNIPTNGALGFPAGTGYDLATGLGSVDVKNLVNAWANAGAGFQGSQTSITSPASINITHGQGVTLNVKVQKAGGGSGPTGNVSLVTDQTVSGIPGTSTIEGLVLSGGNASTGSIDFLPGGTYNIFASYPGDGTFAGSKSAKIAVTVGKENSCVQFGGLTPSAANFSNSLTNVPYGTPLAFTVFMVTGASNSCGGDGFATGTITSITNTGTSSGTLTSAALNLNAEASTEFFDCDPFDTPATTSCFTPGTYTVDANYSGDNSFNPGSASGSNPSQTISVQIVKAPTATVVNPSSTILSRNGSITLTGIVETDSTGLAPTGASTVQFLNSGVVIASVPVAPVVKAPRGPTFRYWPLLVSALILLLAYALSRPRTRRVYAFSGFAALALLAIAFAGCGGGNNGGGGGGGGGGGTLQIGAVTLVSSSNGNPVTPATLTVQTTLTTTFKSGTILSITANYPGDSNYSATAANNRTPVTITVQ